MSASIRTLGASQVSATATNSKATVTIPSDVAVGDKLIAVTAYNPATSTPTTPSGWTQRGSDITVSASMVGKIWMKTAASGDAGTGLTVTWSANQKKFLGVVALGGVGDVDVYATDVTNPGSTTVPAPSVSVGMPSVGVAILMERTSTPSTSFTQPSGYTMPAGASAFGTLSGVVSGAIAYNLTEIDDASVGGGNWTTSASNVGELRIIIAPQVAALTTLATSVTMAGTAANVKAATTTLAVTATVGGVPGGLNPATTTAPAVSVSFAGSATSVTPPDVVGNLAYPVVAAHRGGNPGPEETMSAYATVAAIDPSVALEMDLQILSDGTTLVLNHDDDIDRMASVSSPITTGNVADLSPGQWATLLWHINAGFTGPDQPAAFWSDIVTTYGWNSGAGAGTRLLIPEIKSGIDATVVIDAIKRTGMHDQCIVQAFTLADAQEAAAAGLHAMHLVNSPNFATLSASGIEHIGVAVGSLTQQIVDDAHAVGIRVWAYTISSVASRDALYAMGVDGIITNSPSLMVGRSVAAPAVTVAMAGQATILRPAATTLGPTVAFTAEAARTQAVTTSLAVVAAMAGNPAGSNAAVTAFPATVQLGGLASTTVAAATTMPVTVTLAGDASQAITSPTALPVAVAFGADASLVRATTTTLAVAVSLPATGTVLEGTTPHAGTLTVRRIYYRDGVRV